jgi:hypothetical protein
MSATMARQGGRVQLEQSDMRLALNMAKMAKEGFRMPQLRKQNISLRNHAPRSEKRRSGVLSFLGIKR